MNELDKDITTNIKPKKKSHFLEWIIVIAIVISLGIGFGAGYFLGPRDTIVDKDEDNLLQEVYEIIDEDWYNARGEELNIDEAAIDALLGSINDPHTSYLTQEEALDFNNDVSGTYEGIGVGFHTVDSGAMIVRVYEHTPSEEVGLQAGEIITAVDGTSLAGKNDDEIKELVRGPEGTSVELTLVSGSTNRTVTVERRALDISVTAEVREVDGIKYGYVEITTFGLDTASALENALKEFEQQGITTLVIDVRDNGGGYLVAAQEILDLFIEKGETIYQLQGADGPPEETKASGGTKYRFENSYILMNENSASASELTAGSLQEKANFTLIGSSTFGKGTAQTQATLSDGSVVKYTYASWLTANGKTIEGVGLTPDIEVDNASLDGIMIEEFEQALEVDSVHDAIESMQSMLKILGYDVDRTDGYFSNSTKEALMQFEKDAKIEENGKYDVTDQAYLVSYFMIHANEDENDLQYRELEQQIKKVNQ